MAIDHHDPRMQKGSAVIAVGMLVAALVNWWRTLFMGSEPFAFFDLDFYRRSLDSVASGGLLYDSLAYPPVTLIVLSPLRGLPVLAGNMLWTGVSLLTGVALALAIVHLTTPFLAERSRTRTLYALRGAAAGWILLVSFPMWSQLINGQLTLLVLTLAFVDATGLVPRRYQGSLVGIAGAFKLTPLIFLPYYAVTRQWRALVNAAISFAVTTAIGFVLFPRDSAYFWLHANSQEVQGPTRRDNVSLLGLIRRWWPDETQAQWIWLVLAGAVGLLALYRAWSHFRRGEQVQAALVIGCLSTVVSPIAWIHYQVWVVLAALWMMFSGRRSLMVKGTAVAVLFAQPFPMVAAGLYETSVVARVLWELLVIVPAAICVLGLPRSPEPLSSDETASAQRGDVDQLLDPPVVQT